MRAVDLIQKKRNAGELSTEEIRFLVNEYTKGNIPEYQMSAFTMAVYFQGMTPEEITALCLAMADSGDKLDMSRIEGTVVDKHSTGGVGDKTTLILAPMLAAVGVPVAKMSGRGLGHTGGTIDKLEAIPGMKTQLEMDEFFAQVQAIGLAVAGQTGHLAPADKKLYGLRDVTATVDSISLIASSVMSKKIASGADAIVLDVKVGDGAFMKTLDRAKELAEIMVEIGERAGRKTVAVLSRMEEPLGYAIGNTLEVREAVETLRGEGPTDLTELCLTLGAQMVLLAGKASDEGAARRMLEEVLQNGLAVEKFVQFVRAQGGQVESVENLSLLPSARVVRVMNAEVSGYVHKVHAQACGEVAMHLGAGRAKADDMIDPAVGLVLRVKVGDRVEEGQPLIEIHAQTEEAALRAQQELASVFNIEEQEQSASQSIVIETITKKSAKGKHENVLVQAAVHAREHAYVPYSEFPVGAALRLKDGTVFTGANIENASFGLTNCAERTTIFRAIAELGRGALDIEAVAVAADTRDPVSPCGACRQVLAEFCRPETPVYLANLGGAVLETTVGKLLPYAFEAQHME